MGARNPGLKIAGLSRAVLSAVLALLCCSCGAGKARKPTHPVEGRVYWKDRKTPATNALVVFRPVKGDSSDEWAAGFPRGRVGPDGFFKLTTDGERDGAPAGEYVVLIQWPRSAVPEGGRLEEAGDEDRLGGAYSDVRNPRWRRQVNEAGNDPNDFVFVLK